jgi:tetratricopeptide (TPR) repeat protein
MLSNGYLLRGIQRVDKGDLEGAITDYDQAIRLNPNNDEAYYNRGIWRSEKGDIDGAIADYDQAIRLNPKAASAYINRGAARYRKGDTDGSIADLDRAVELNPKNALAYSNRCFTIKLKGDFDDAIADCDQAIRLDANNVRAFVNRALVRQAMGDIDGAIADYDQAIRLDPKFVGARFNRGNVYLKNGNFDRAIADYAQAILIDPKFIDAYLMRGHTYERKGDHDRAVADFNQAIRIETGPLQAFMRLGDLLRGQNQFEECADAYSRGIGAIDKPKKDNWLVFYFRGICYDHENQWAKAELDFKKALELNPDQPLVMNYLGFSWVDRGLNQEEGLRLIRRALEQRPDDGYIVDSLGWAFYQSAQYEDALTQLKRAVELKPNDPTLADHLGDAFWKLGQYSEAKSRWARALTLRPTSDDLKRIDAKLRTENPEPRPAIAVATSPSSVKDAAAERRVALVIGNSNYLTFPKILNPRNDAEDVAKELRDLGFEVLLGTDLKRADMEDMLIRFAKNAREADTALVFYAGHGLQHQGIDYLAPVDARVDDETDLRKLINLQDVIGDLQNAAHVRILIVDACRDNEVMQQVASKLPATRSAAFTRGLAAVSGADGTIIAFATQPNRVAADGLGRNSPFTQALLKNLPTPGLELRTLMTRVRAEVVAATGGAQRPEVWDSLVGEFAFKAEQ